jgi:hypothetical protein
MTQTLTLPGVALQWKAVGPFNQPLTATVSIRPHFPFSEGARISSVVFPATNISPSSASFIATPIIGTFDSNGRLVGPDGYPLVVPGLDVGWEVWLLNPVFYEIQIDVLGMSSQRGIFVAFQDPTNNFQAGNSGILLGDSNASCSAMTGSGDSYAGTVYLGDTVVSPVLVNQSVTVGDFTAVVTSIDLATNSAAVTTAAAQDANPNLTFWWGGDTNCAVDLSQYVNWL